MGESILVALITGIFTCLGTVLSVSSSVRKSNDLVTYRMDKIEEKFDKMEVKVDKHNNMVERMAVAERDIKSAFRLIDDMK